MVIFFFSLVMDSLFLLLHEWTAWWSILYLRTAWKFSLCFWIAINWLLVCSLLHTVSKHSVFFFWIDKFAVGLFFTHAEQRAMVYKLLRSKCPSLDSKTVDLTSGATLHFVWNVAIKSLVMLFVLLHFRLQIHPTLAPLIQKRRLCMSDV